MVSAENKTRKVYTVLFIVFGLLFIAATAWTTLSLFSVYDLLANSTHVNGQVVNLVAGAKGTHAPVVRFQTTSGETVVLTSDLFSSPGPNVGDNVNVIYRNSNPRDWKIDDWFHLYFLTLMGSIFMFAWGFALVITAAIRHSQIRKLVP